MLAAHEEMLRLYKQKAGKAFMTVMSMLVYSDVTSILAWTDASDLSQLKKKAGANPLC